MCEDFLFVYGKLRQHSDSEISRLFFNHARNVGPARFQGRLYQIAHYPGAVPSDDPQDQIVGQLLALPCDEPLWRAIDEYEGIGPDFSEPFEYERCKMPVSLADGTHVEAWIYIYRRDLSDSDRISHGDYFRFLEVAPL
ncbi:gamma-glutamylcyclotransferase family protein [uncultured Cohaesibacter sp.]|uniref:gamma-glutamylcyclotransferase family protein n=1 Tax=uncultured Cohaesibacter sp. TaxID=1002546 RepID=UPI002AAB6EF2|nr:gamma-glutamylcyclotransferase family protein [uncultured Cohaesibacter sp.]